MSIIIPKHEQHYPDHLMPTRLQEYVLMDGRPPTMNRAYAVRVTGQQVFDGITAAQARLGLSNVDPRYYVATCFHEAGCSNEWDTEIATSSSPGGFQSVGAFQIGYEEATRYHFQLVDMLDFDKSCECFVQLAEDNRRAVRAAALIAGDDPDYTDAKGRVWKGGSMRAYMAMAHNKGTGYARITIHNYGLNWDAYKQRNPTDPLVAHGYGDDCITGGSYFPGNMPPHPLNHRTLELTHPFTTGDDVREVQQHLNISADGVFGPGTEAAVITFQKSKGLPADGIVGPGTWAALLAT